MIELQQVCAGYRGTDVLHKISLRPQEKKLTVLIGPNGCGKSTLLRVMAGLVKPTQGAVCWDGTPLTRLPQHNVPQRIAFLPQSRPVPALSAQRLVLHGRFPYLSFPRHYRTQDYVAVQTALRQMDIEHLAHKTLTQMSGGERQKVYLAMALAQDTPLVLLDEPAANLDICHQLAVMRLARSLCKMGKTVMMVTHELEQGLRYAHRVCIMEQGTIVCESDSAQVDAAMLSRVFGVKAQKLAEGWRFDEAGDIE